MAKFNYKIIFRPICWITGIIETVRYNKTFTYYIESSGHQFVGENQYSDLLCEICGYVSSHSKPLVKKDK
jgi:hypothetical protein